MVAATCAVLAAAAVSSCGSAPSPEAVARSFARAVDTQRWPAAAALTSGSATAALQSVYGAAHVALAATRSVTTVGPVRVAGATATAPLTTALTSSVFGAVTLHATATLRRIGGSWKLAWSPGTFDARLGAGDRIVRTATFSPRAAVLGAGGVSLTPAGVTVGLVGARVTNAAQVAQLLEGAGFPAASVTADLSRAAAVPTQLVPVGVLPQATFEAIKAQPAPSLYSVGGTAFVAGAQAPLTPELGAHLVGTVGPITAEELRRLGAPYMATDQVGQGGLEAAYERQLAGTPAQAAEVVDAHGAAVATLATAAAVAGTPVTTTIDPTVQRAAEAALAALPASAQAALVVERVSTGEVLATVSRPSTTAFDLALDGKVPPGSTFKVITATDLLEHAATPTSPATCPPTLTVNGQQFKNFEAESAASLSLAQAFAVSCNTAFIGLAASLPADSFAATAAQFGLGVAGVAQPGVPVAATAVPTPKSPNEQAATAIGQGGVVVSPLAMASVAATVASGSYHPPRIVVGAPADSAAPVALPTGVADEMRTLMAGVVTGAGTAAAAGLPPGTFGKTGTAEFGNGPNPPTHAWFIGFRGDIAVSVFVYGGGVGGAVAAPLAAALLKGLPAAR